MKPHVFTGRVARLPAVLIFSVLLVFFALAAGCGRGGSRAAIADVAAMTEETLTDLLLGVPPERAATRTAPPDPPLLKRGVYETAIIAADAKGFAEVSRGTITADDIRALEKRVVEQVNKRLQGKGFSAEQASYPVGSVDRAKAVVVTLTPTTQEGGSPQDRAENRGRTYILVRLMVADPNTRVILAQRDYYSGQELRGQGRRQQPRR